MRKHTYEPYVGQVWATANQEQFVIDELANPDDPWVTYTKIQTGQTYNCRLEAFKQRFYPLAD